MGLRLILALLKLLLTLIRLGRRLKPSERLCVFLPGIYKLQVGLGLVFLACKYIGQGGGKREEEKKGEERKKEGKGKEDDAGCTKGLIKQNSCIASVLCVMFFSSFKPSPGAMALKLNPSF